jgi:MSHA biogenesis protein MshE
MSLQVVIAQRLVRRVCSSCGGPYLPEAQERAFLARVAPGRAVDALRQGAGCVDCNGTGYAGRIGVFEMLCLDAELVDALPQRDSSAFARLAQQRIGDRTLVHHAVERALGGQTTVAEAMQVASQDFEAR